MKRVAATAWFLHTDVSALREEFALTTRHLRESAGARLHLCEKKCGTLTGKDPVPPMTTRCIYSLWCRVPPGDRIQLRAIGYQTT
jgi:hypothetical protein